MDAKTTIFEQAHRIRDNWRETWWAMADGSKSEYDRIKSTETFEFWKIFDLWSAKMEHDRDRLKNLKNKNNHGRG